MTTNARSQHIAVFFGGVSPEHDISIITGQMVVAGLRGLGHDVVPVYIARSGRWLVGDEFGELKTFTAGVVDDTRAPRWDLDLERSVGRLVFRRRGWRRATLEADVAFPATHGVNGEDGALMGVFEMLRVPYVGCDVASSAVAMDKALTKTVCQAAGFPTTTFRSFSAADWRRSRSDVLARLRGDLTAPLFVKPAHLGSSIGIAKVREASGDELAERIEVALCYDDKVVVEEAVADVMDVTCCVIGNDTPTPSLLQESVFSADLFDFDAKYLAGGGAQLGKAGSGVVIPARLPDDVTARVRDTAVKVYQALGCAGIARVDFLYDRASSQAYVNEVNPLPGTLYHHLWKASGLDLPELLTKLIGFAVERHTARAALTRTFTSSVLTKLGIMKGGRKLG
jgi:D-alanine-D-alanine ligase